MNFKNLVYNIHDKLFYAFDKIGKYEYNLQKLSLLLFEYFTHVETGTKSQSSRVLSKPSIQEAVYIREMYKEAKRHSEYEMQMQNLATLKTMTGLVGVYCGLQLGGPIVALLASIADLPIMLKLAFDINNRKKKSENTILAYLFPPGSEIDESKIPEVCVLKDVIVKNFYDTWYY